MTTAHIRLKHYDLCYIIYNAIVNVMNSYRDIITKSDTRLLRFLVSHYHIQVSQEE